MTANTPLRKDLVDLLWLLVGAGYESTPFNRLPPNWQTVALQVGKYLIEPTVPIAPTIHNRLWLVDAKGHPRGFPRWKPSPMAENQYCMATLKLRNRRAKERRMIDEGESVPMYLGPVPTPTPSDSEITEAAFEAAAEEVFGEGSTPRVNLLEEEEIQVQVTVDWEQDE